MGLWDSIKGAVIEDDGEKPQAKVAPAPVTSAAPAPRAVTAPVAGTPYVPQPVVNADMVNAIRNKTFARNTALTALISASDALSGIPGMTDSMRLQAAAKTAGAGRKTSDFVDAVQIHLNDVDAAERDFSNMVQTKVNADCGDLKKQADAAALTAKQKTERASQLQQEIAQLQSDSEAALTASHDLGQKAANKEADLRKSETEFKVAANAVRDELNGQKQTILSTLG